MSAKLRTEKNDGRTIRDPDGVLDDIAVGPEDILGADLCWSGTDEWSAVSLPVCAPLVQLEPAVDAYTNISPVAPTAVYQLLHGHLLGLWHHFDSLFVSKAVCLVQMFGMARGE